LIYIARSTIKSMVLASTLHIWRHEYCSHFNFIILFTCISSLLLFAWRC